MLSLVRRYHGVVRESSSQNGADPKAPMSTVHISNAHDVFSLLRFIVTFVSLLQAGLTLDGVFNVFAWSPVSASSWPYS